MKLYTITFAIALIALAGCGGNGSSSVSVSRPAGSFYGTFQADIVNPSSGTADFVVSTSGTLTGTMSNGGTITATENSTAKVTGTYTVDGVAEPYAGYVFQQDSAFDISGYVTDAQGHGWALNFTLTKQ